MLDPERPRRLGRQAAHLGQPVRGVSPRAEPDCAAREVTVLVERDGVGAGRRADVRALRALDYPAHLDEPRVYAHGLVARKLRGAPDGKSLERRQNTEPLDLLIP